MNFNLSKNREAAIVYFRAGYAPSHYETQREWDALLMIECSKAIKCPSVGVFLSGMKIIQEYITDDENLNDITGDCEASEELKAVFGKYYSLTSNVKN